MNRTFIALLVGLAVTCGRAPALAQVGPQGDPFVCYKSRSLGGRNGLPSFTPRDEAVVIDTFSTARPDDQHKVDLTKSIGLCAPAGLNGELQLDPATHLEAYSLKVSKTTPRQPRHTDSLHEVVNVFGTLKLRVFGDDRLLAPTNKALGTGGVDALVGPGLHYKCYDAKVAKAGPGSPPFPTFTPTQTSVTDQFGTRLLNVSKPRRFCAPADLDATDPSAPTNVRYLVCYGVRLAPTRPKQPRSVATAVSTHPSFGPEALSVGKAQELCVPSFKDPAQPTPVPTATPGGGGTGEVLAIHIAPKTRYVSPGGTSTFTATADLAGGGTANYTQKVIWTSNNPGVALAKNVDGDRSRIEAVSPGIATISATDPVSGVTSTTSSDDAQFNVPGDLLSITLTPVAPGIDVGAAKSLVAMGSFEGGVTRNITQQLDYTSSDPSVATATNLDGNKSRIEGVAPGTSTISAADPVTGVSSADSGGNSVVTVLGALQSITLAPLEKSKPAGQFVSYVATGHYAGGGTQNITQDVDYASSDPTVAAASNTPGNKGRIDTIAPGTATISASDPVSGITTTAGGNDATLTVTAAVSNLLSITLSPTSATRSVGELQNFTATGHYEGGGTQNLTQHVQYTSSDPSVVSAPNEPGNLGKVVMVAPGTATITATDPVSGISTTDSGDDATITVLGALERIELSPLQATRAVGQLITYTAIGHFGGGTTKNLTQRLVYASSDPTVANAPNETGNKSKVVSVAPGIVTITATDPTSGVSTTDTGDDVTLTVIGALERITLSPVTSTKAPGAIQRYTATGYFGGGITQNLTQSLIYSSSDPSVATAQNIDGDRSRIDAIAPGTATISATHPTAGVSTTDTGDDATLTVTP